MHIRPGFAVLRSASAGAAGAPVDAEPGVHRRGRLSVQTYAFLLVLAVALPLGALLVAALRQIAAQDESQAGTTVRQLARISAAEADLFLTDARGLLEQVAARPGVRSPDPARCDSVFADFSTQQAPLVNLVLVDPEGRAICSTLPPPRGPS